MMDLVHAWCTGADFAEICAASKSTPPFSSLFFITRKPRVE